jgi:hypothetical protein
MAATGYDDRILLVEVTGLRQQSVMHTSHYTFKVPYCSLARTLQFISRSGGKVVRIQILAAALPTQTRLQSSSLLEEIAAPRSPASGADVKIEASASTHPSVASAAGELPSPLPIEPQPSKLSRLGRILLEKLKSFAWVHPGQ